MQQEDIDTAMDGFAPAASWGVGAAAAGPAGPRGWQDVGGLAEVRGALQEIMDLPTRFAKLIARHVANCMPVSKAMISWVQVGHWLLGCPQRVAA